MTKKKKRKSAVRDATSARRVGTATMTTEPFAPESGADPENGTAPIVPVSTEMMDHAAQAIAQQADALAHTSLEKPSEAHDEASTSVGTPAPDAELTPATPDLAVAANENDSAAGDVVSTTAPGPEQAADLAFTQGAGRTERSAARGSRDASASVDGLGLFNAKMMEIAAINMAAAGEFVSALLTAKTVPEAAAVNALHMRRAYETLSSQGRELMILGQKVALDAAQTTAEASGRR